MWPAAVSAVSAVSPVSRVSPVSPVSPVFRFLHTQDNKTDDWGHVDQSLSQPDTAVQMASFIHSFILTSVMWSRFPLMLTVVVSHLAIRVFI